VTPAGWSGQALRFALIGCIAVGLAFAAGAGLRLSSDSSDTVAPERARSIDGGGTLREVRLRRVDPGVLPRATQPPPGAPRRSVQSNLAVSPASSPAAAAPEPEAPAPQPSSPADGGGTFDSSEQAEPSEENSFDSEG
jgi:hypothetical protein